MVNIAFNLAQLKSIILKNINTYPMICVSSVGSSNTSAATIKFNIGLIYKSMPILDELTPFKAYRFSQSGTIVNITANKNTCQ